MDISGYFLLRSSSSISKRCLEQIQAILRPAKAIGRRGFGHNHQTGTPRIAQPCLQVVDFVADMMQSATLLEEIADRRRFAGGLDQLIDRVAYVERSKKSDANPLYGIMRNLAIPLRRDGKRKFLSDRRDRRHHKTQMMECAVAAGQESGPLSLLGS